MFLYSVRRVFLLTVIASLCACGGGKGAGSGGVSSASIGSLAILTSQAARSDLAYVGQSKGITPFIAFVALHASTLNELKSISYTIQPKPGSVSKPVNVSYTIKALIRRAPRSAFAGNIDLPIFGLYSGYANEISVQAMFSDGSTFTIPVVVISDTYRDPNDIYDKPLFIKKRDPGSTLGFDFFAMKSNLGTPVIVDTDGAIRWMGTGINSSISSILIDNGFLIGDQDSTNIYRLEFDGRISTKNLISTNYKSFHHNLDPGRIGILAEITTGADIESTINELTPTSGFGKEWSLAKLISEYMRSQGDDPTLFVRRGADWFHSNAVTYDPRDNSLIVSSRENFIVKISYDTGTIIWIFGDPTKYWYTFPSLRAKALTLAPGGLYPVGQHATSITSDGLLMIINDGRGSAHQPAGTSGGVSRSYTAISAYSIDTVNSSATEVWRFDNGQTILSAICNSSYEVQDKSLLVDYAVADNLTHTRLVGLDSSHNVVFDFQYKNDAGCNTSWNAVPVNFDQMKFNE